MDEAYAAFAAGAKKAEANAIELKRFMASTPIRKK